MKIEMYSYSQDKQRRVGDIENIFWLTATNAPDNVEDKKTFFYKYCKVYIEHWPDDVYISCDDLGNTTGYLLGCRDSAKATPILSPHIKSYSLFQDLYDRFPAHLHMDVHPEHQGKQIGTFLFNQFRSDLCEQKIKGMHILNSPSAKNLNFYRRNGMIFEVIRSFKDKPLLFMGAKTS